MIASGLDMGIIMSVAVTMLWVKSMKFQLGAMSLGDILDRGVKILFARFGTFLAINLLLLVPMLASQLVIPWIPLEMQSLPGMVYTLLFLFLLPVSSGATVQIIAKEYIGEPVSAVSAIRFAYERIWDLLGATILAGLIIFLGACMLIIPMFVFMMMYALINQVVMLEGLRGRQALSRSAELTSGFRWRILGIELMIFFVTTVVMLPLYIWFPLGGPTTRFLQGPPYVEAVNTPWNHPNYEIYHVANFVMQALLVPYGVVCLTLVYFDLRTRKEGFDLEIAVRKTITLQ